jgi:hypothetical protein
VDYIQLAQLLLPVADSCEWDKTSISFKGGKLFDQVSRHQLPRKVSALGCLFISLSVYYLTTLLVAQTI